MSYDNLGRFKVIRNGTSFSVIDEAITDRADRSVLTTTNRAKAWREAARLDREAKAATEIREDA